MRWNGKAPGHEPPPQGAAGHVERPGEGAYRAQFRGEFERFSDEASCIDVHLDPTPRQVIGYFQGELRRESTKNRSEFFDVDLSHVRENAVRPASGHELKKCVVALELS
jgi:hypothetical protein